MLQENEESEKKSAFAGFTGFSKGITPSSTPTNNTFSFLSNTVTKPEQSKINGFSSKPENSMKSTESASGNSGVLGTSLVSQEKTEKSDDYYSKLKGLNESVSKWIKQHVDANPFINLQPIFRDYESYFKELESGKIAIETKTNETKKKEEAVSSMSNFVFKAVETVPDSTTGKIQEKKKSSSLNSTQIGRAHV